MFSKYIDIIIHQQEFTDHLLVNKILHYLYLHIEDEVSLKKVTQALNISQSYASRIFKDVMNTSIIKYSKKLKIERAKSLLRSNESITSIGEKLGFYDQAHFSRTFKSLTGYSPQNYKIKEKTIEN
jgi:AraC-like DNA-binding protein